jgi:hypothetical protein
VCRPGASGPRMEVVDQVDGNWASRHDRFRFSEAGERIYNQIPKSRERAHGKIGRSLYLLSCALFLSHMCALGLMRDGQEHTILETAMDTSLERQFAEAMHCVAAVREGNKSTGIDVVNCFGSITEAYPLSVFQAYLTQRYKRIRVKDIGGNAEYYELDASILRQFDRRFFSKDQVRIGFRYSDDWNDITKFFANLGNLAV